MPEKTYDALMIAKYEQLLDEINTEKERWCAECGEETTHLFISSLSEEAEEDGTRPVHEVTFQWRCDKCYEAINVSTFRFATKLTGN
jgi:ribosomal protein L44E